MEKRESIRTSIDKRDEADLTVSAVAEDRVRAHDEFTEQEYSKLMRKVDFILMVSSRWLFLYFYRSRPLA